MPLFFNLKRYGKAQCSCNIKWDLAQLDCLICGLMMNSPYKYTANTNRNHNWKNPCINIITNVYGPVRDSNLGPLNLLQGAQYQLSNLVPVIKPVWGSHSFPIKWYLLMVFPLAGVNLSVSGFGTVPNVTGYGRNNDGPDWVWFWVPWLSSQLDALSHLATTIELVNWGYITFETILYR